MDFISVCVVNRRGRGLVLRWRDPYTGRVREQKCSQDPKAAQREAQAKEDELQYRPGELIADIGLDDLVARYRREHLADCARDYSYQLDAALSRLRAVAAARKTPLSGRTITTELIAAAMQEIKGDVAPSTVRSYKTALAAFLRWAYRLQLARPIDWEACRVSVPDPSGGRPITGEEFDRMLEATASVVAPCQVEPFRNLMRGMFLGGLRLGEALQLNAWREDCHQVDLRSDPPRLLFLATQKNRTYQEIAMVDDLAELLRSVPVDADGYFFRVRTLTGEPFASAKRVGERIAGIGKAARVRTKIDARGNPRFARAHDLRRSFAKRWSAKLRPAALMHLMRHADISTTLKYYAGDMASVVADELRGVSDNHVTRAPSPRAKKGRNSRV